MMLWMIIIIKREEKSYCKWFRNDQMWMYSETESNLDCHNISLSEYFIRNCSILGGIILTRVTFSDQIHWSSIIIFIVKKKKRKSVADSIQNGVQSLKSPTNQIESDQIQSMIEFWSEKNKTNQWAYRIAEKVLHLPLRSKFACSIWIALFSEAFIVHRERRWISTTHSWFSIDSFNMILHFRFDCFHNSLI